MVRNTGAQSQLFFAQYETMLDAERQMAIVSRAAVYMTALSLVAIFTCVMAFS